MFFQTADASLAAGTYNYTNHVFVYPTNTMFQPTIKITYTILSDRLTTVHLSV